MQQIHYELNTDSSFEFFLNKAFSPNEAPIENQLKHYYQQMVKVENLGEHGIEIQLTRTWKDSAKKLNSEKYIDVELTLEEAKALGTFLKKAGFVD